MSVALILSVVPYIGTWIETKEGLPKISSLRVVPYIGTWIETHSNSKRLVLSIGRTLYRYVD